MKIQELEPIIKRIANKTHHISPVISKEDLEQVGRLSAFKALRSFDPTKGKSIKSYIYKCVQRAIYEEASSFYGPYRLPHRILRLCSKINTLAGVEASGEEISSILNAEKSPIKKTTPDTVRKLKVLYRGVASDSDCLCSNDDHFLQEITVSELERNILYYRYIHNYSLKETSQILGISIGRLRGLEAILKGRIRDLYE